MNMISDLPEEMLSIIASQLKFNEIRSLSQTSRFFRETFHPLFKSYQDTLNQIFTGLSAQHKKVIKEIESKRAACLALQKAFDSNNCAPAISSHLDELNEKQREIREKQKSFSSEEPKDLELRQQQFEAFEVSLSDIRKQIEETKVNLQKEITSDSYLSLVFELEEAKRTYITILQCRIIPNDTSEKKLIRDRKFGIVIREIFKAIVGKEKPVIKIKETTVITSNNDFLARYADSKAITVFINPQGVRSVILKSSTKKFKFIQECDTDILRLSTSGPFGSKIYLTDRDDNLDLQKLKQSAEFLKPIIEEICPKPKDDDAAAAAL